MRTDDDMATHPYFDGGFDQLIEQYTPLVKRIAYHLMTRLPSSVSVDDLIQAGMVGLLEASRNYKPQLGASFETYAGIRIRGAMLDELRKNDWAPKSVHRKAREMAEVVREIEAREGRDARDEEVARAMGLTMEEYYKILQDANTSRMLAFEELGVDEEAISRGMLEQGTGPLDDTARQRFQKRLAEAIARLPERERLVVSLYYDRELNLREIGQLLGVSESRISQLLGQAMIRLRARLRDWQGR